MTRPDWYILAAVVVLWLLGVAVWQMLPGWLESR